MFFLFELVFVTIILSLSIGVSILITQPFSGALVRLRANYLPKAVSLDNVLEDGRQSGPGGLSALFLSQRREAAKIGPVVGGIFAMLSRTKRLEGWAGVYKGSAPTVLQLLYISLVTWLLFDVKSTGGAYKSAPSAPGEFKLFSNLFFMILVAIAALPLNVIGHRTIVHPRILPWKQPRQNLQELLSISEFNQPWRLYLLPGLLPATMLHVLWIGLVTRLVRQWTVPAMGGLPRPKPAGEDDKTYDGRVLEVSNFGLTVFLVWNVLSVVILAPLECAMVRLATQRPERQQPLHVAYARAASSAPAPYSHQASVPAQSQPGSTYTDAAPSSNGKPEKADLGSRASRPSFAIEDEDEDEVRDQVRSELANETNPGEESSSEPPAAPAPAPAPTRVLGSSYPSSVTAPAPYNARDMPPEPVIALRPCDEPRTAEEAARAEAEEFGAPVVERYTGLVDCLRKMVDEEGVESLARGWWVTVAAVFAGVLA